MKCQACGGVMEAITSDMPFKLDHNRIVIIKDLPVLLCAECGEHNFTDAVMAKIDDTLNKVDRGAELEIIRFAA